MAASRRFIWTTRMRPFRRWAVTQVSYRMERGVKRVRFDEISSHFTEKAARRAATRLNEKTLHERWSE